MFENNSTQSRGRNRIGRDDAAMWFLRLRENDVTEQDFAEWRSWLAQDKSHEQEFDEVVELWSACDQLDDLPWPSSEEIEKETRPAKYRFRGALTEFMNMCIPRHAMLVCSLLLLSALTVYLYQEQVSEQTLPQQFRTTTAEHRTIKLLDGSVVVLGAKTKVSVLYTDAERSITLHQGEAFFEVFKDRDRPFLVTAGQRAIRAVGTAFNINMGAEKVTVTVVEGLVRIEPKNKGETEPGPDKPQIQADDVNAITNVSGGHGVIYDSRGVLKSLPESNTETATSWQDGRLVFIDKTLDAVIADINRYSAREIIISDNELEDLRYTGTVFQDEISGWLNGLDKAFPVRIIELGERELVVIARKDF